MYEHLFDITRPIASEEDRVEDLHRSAPKSATPKIHDLTRALRERQGTRIAALTRGEPNT